MKQMTLLACVLALSTPATPAFAGGQEDSLGIGAEFLMNGLTGGPSVNYDLGKMHFGGFFAFYDDGDESSDYTFGGRFYYHLHSTAMSDFGFGGALGFYSDEDMDNRNSFMFLEPSFQIRAFVAANVALSVNAGVVIALQDADGFAITAGSDVDGDTGRRGVTGGAGIHYYFF